MGARGEESAFADLSAGELRNTRSFKAWGLLKGRTAGVCVLMCARHSPGPCGPLHLHTPRSQEHVPLAERVASA